MEFWKSVEIVKLLKEVEIIQRYLKTTTATSIVNEISKKFKREMRKSCVHNAMKLLTDNMKMVLFVYLRKHCHSQNRNILLDAILIRSINTGQTKRNTPNSICLNRCRKS